MGAFPIFRFFRLSDEGVRCDENGLFVGGYDDHHLVQQNDRNIAKPPRDVHSEKFGWNVINAPSDRVWIPRVKHRLITNWYNSKYPNDPLGRRRRELVSEMDYDAQYQDALTTLQMFGVLQ
jgi:hypothetical protein